MSEPTTAAPDASTTTVVATPPAAPPSASPKSHSWIGVAVLFVVVALLAGMTAVLFVRVQRAQDRADEAIAALTAQDAIRADLDRVDASVRAVDTSQQDAATQVDKISDQVGAMRKCVNNAFDAWAQATQSGKPVSITKC